MRGLISSLALVLLIAPVVARSPAPEDAQVYFISPTDGDTVVSPVTIRFGLRGMGVAPAGINLPATGHLHLLVNTKPPSPKLPIPGDAHHLHFGGGQTETEIELPPGEHTLQLLLGDHMHVPHDPPVISSPITITVR